MIKSSKQIFYISIYNNSYSFTLISFTIYQDCTTILDNVRSSNKNNL